MPKYRRSRIALQRLGDLHEGPPADQIDVKILAALQEDPFRSALVDAPEADEILSLERQIAVVRHAERHAHVGGFVAFDAIGRPHDVERQHTDREESEEEKCDRQTGIARRHLECLAASAIRRR